MDGSFELRSLRERPFDLLRELDRRARTAAQGKPEAAASGAEWVGIAFRLGGEAFYTVSGLRFGAEAVWHDRQDRTAPEERATDGYTMLNLEASWRRSLGAAGLHVFLRGTNLLDEEARRHSSPLKDYAPLAGRAVSGGLRLEF